MNGMSKKEMDKIVLEVKERLGMQHHEKEKCNKAIWLLLSGTVFVALVAVVLWLRSKEDEDIEEYYEYFDDELDDDDDIYGELTEDEDVEYLEIKQFDEVAGEDEVEVETETE
ncbi:MAG: hypothetical protein ATN34_01815 [Epulopiscium sp. Nele67-Bin002]|nr:MAG: hypothetical protein ATN34_01815 [Epulopiscium sp. Nele67-Bin002]OON93804.1 MAG: hypothetical protein ATN33_05255 [Epulopiscium sp. Nele67-Bin001]